MTVRRLALLAALAVAALVAGLLAGPVPLSFREVWSGLVDPGAASAAVVRVVRAPRVALAFVAGGSLAVAGAVLQAVVRNPLADPFLLGLSGGAGLGAVLAISLHLPGPLAVPLAAFLGALAAIALVYRIALVAGHRLDPNVLLLAGVVVGAFAGALMSALIAVSAAADLKGAMGWLLGGFGSASWGALGVLLVLACPALAVLWSQARPLDLLALGDEPAQHLGADVARLRVVAYLAASLLTAACVAASGIVGFVGLVVPHALRRLGLPLHRALLPAAFLAGGAFLVACDALARVVVAPLELPVGVLTALVGVPLFALLLRRSLA